MSGLRVGLHRHDYDVIEYPVADEGLLPVHDVTVAAPHGGGAHGGEIAACAGLGHGNSADPFTGGHFRQPALLLLLRAIVGDVGNHHVSMQGEVNAAGPGVREFFDHD